MARDLLGHFLPIGHGRPLIRSAVFDTNLVERLNRLPNTSETVFDELQSVNFSTGVEGFRIQSDGTAEFASGLTIGGGITINADLESGNWGGASPADLSTTPDATLLGYYLDYSAGVAQFQKVYARGGILYDLAVSGLLSVDSAGDIYSTAWDGTNPANIGTVPDAAATAGWWIDGGGAAQFMKLWAEGGAMTDLSITGTLTFDSGELLTDAAKPRWRLADSTSDSSVITNVFEYQYANGDEYNAKVAVNDDSIGLYARVIESTAVQQSAVIVSRVQGTTAAARVFLTNDQGYNNDSTWIELYDPGSAGSIVKAQEFGAGSDYSASNLGAGNSAFRFWNKGDGSGVNIFGNPTGAEEVVNVFKGTPISSETKLWAVNSDGEMNENAVTLFPTWAYTKPTQITTFASTNWTAVPGTLTLWTHSGTNRSAYVEAEFRFDWGETAAVAYTGECRVGVSVDGGSTWAYGTTSIAFVGTGTGGCGYRASGSVYYAGEHASATGDIQVRAEYKVGNTSMDRIVGMHLKARAVQYF